MTSPWVVTTSTERVNLDAQRQGELTFTVTNASDATDQVVFEPVAGEGVESSALTVDEPGRRVPGRGSASFLVHIAIPQQAAAGRYELYGQAYSAHLAPEETLGRSGRVVFDVAAPPEPKRRPWWLLAVAALVVIVLVVVGILLFNRGPSTVAVPSVVGQTQAAAGDQLTKAKLKLGTVRRRQDPANDGKVLQQATAPGTKVSTGTAVDVVVGANLRAPNPVLPVPGNVIPPVRAQQFQWGPTPGATSYHLVVSRQFCQVLPIGGGGISTNCRFTPVVDQNVHGTATAIALPPAPTVPVFGNTTTALFQWTVTALDDFGNPGAASSLAQFSVQP
jgi:hypothetical protein